MSIPWVLYGARMLATIASVVALAAPTYGAHHGCDHIHRSSVAYNRVELLLRNHRPHVNKRRVAHYRTCVATRAKSRAVGRHVARQWRWRHSYAHRWPIVFNRLPAYDRAWAISTSSCESGMNPATNTGNGFYGAFQFMLSTWQSAGGSGNPAQHSWSYQAVIAVRWMHIAGASQWPVCG